MRTTQPVCVTGATGFLAAHMVRDLLEQGYRVRGTVRSLEDPSRLEFLTNLPGASERLELCTGELLTPGSFERAIADCRWVLHTASPYTLASVDPQRDLVEPAVEGTRNVLATALAAGVERVVVTSSFAAITDEPVPGKVFDESDWNERSSLRRAPYYYSKTLAERAAWRFVADEYAGLDLVTIQPFMVLGPSLGPGLNTSNAILRDLLTGKFPGILHLNWGLVDVRDVAVAHRLAMEEETAEGRYLCAGPNLAMGEVVAILREGGYDQGYRLPRRDLTGGLATGLAKLLSFTQPKAQGTYLRNHLGKDIAYDNGKIRRELGVTFRPGKETLLDAAADLVRWGHVNGAG